MSNVSNGPWNTTRTPDSPVAQPTGPTYDGSMSMPTREEFDAKLETIEVRMDGRVASIEANINGFMGRMEERSLRSDERFKSMDERMGRFEQIMGDTQTSIQASISNLKTTMIVTALSTVLAIVLGVAAFNSTVLSNMLASFESGKNTSAVQAEVKRQAEETAALLKQLQERMPSTPPMPAPTQQPPTK